MNREKTQASADENEHVQIEKKENGNENRNEKKESKRFSGKITERKLDRGHARRVK